MQYSKAAGAGWYNLIIQRDDTEASEIYKFMLYLDASGLAALIRSVDLATNEGQMARAIGLPRSRRKKRKV